VDVSQWDCTLDKNHQAGKIDWESHRVSDPCQCPSHNPHTYYCSVRWYHDLLLWWICRCKTGHCDTALALILWTACCSLGRVGTGASLSLASLNGGSQRTFVSLVGCIENRTMHASTDWTLPYLSLCLVSRASLLLTSDELLRLCWKCQAGIRRRAARLRTIDADCRLTCGAAAALISLAKAEKHCAPCICPRRQYQQLQSVRSIGSGPQKRICRSSMLVVILNVVHVDHCWSSWNFSSIKRSWNCNLYCTVNWCRTSYMQYSFDSFMKCHQSKAVHRIFFLKKMVYVQGYF